VAVHDAYIDGNLLEGVIRWYDSYKAPNKVIYGH